MFLEIENPVRFYGFCTCALVFSSIYIIATRKKHIHGRTETTAWTVTGLCTFSSLIFSIFKLITSL